MVAYRPRVLCRLDRGIGAQDHAGSSCTRARTGRGLQQLTRFARVAPGLSKWLPRPVGALLLLLYCGSSWLYLGTPGAPPVRDVAFLLVVEGGLLLFSIYWLNSTSTPDDRRNQLVVLGAIVLAVVLSVFRSHGPITLAFVVVHGVGHLTAVRERSVKERWFLLLDIWLPFSLLAVALIASVSLNPPHFAWDFAAVPDTYWITNSDTGRRSPNWIVAAATTYYALYLFYSLMRPHFKTPEEISRDGAGEGT